jgi:hypothetical protein
VYLAIRNQSTAIRAVDFQETENLRLSSMRVQMPGTPEKPIVNAIPMPRTRMEHVQKKPGEPRVDNHVVEIH